MIIPTRAIKSKIKPYLSDKARHRLGGIAFHIYMRLFRWPCGLLFDLCGGHYRNLRLHPFHPQGSYFPQLSRLLHDRRI